MKPELQNAVSVFFIFIVTVYLNGESIKVPFNIMLTLNLHIKINFFSLFY